MKRLLAMALALVLALGLAVPAMATELKSIADEPPEVQEFLREMYEAGLLPENTDYDLSYFEGEQSDPYAEYEAAHPEEIANLDVDQFLADHGFRDRTAEELFLAFYNQYGDTIEEAVKGYYIEQRLYVEYYCQEAEEYRVEYPEEWEGFDADAYFEETLTTGEYGWESKEAYMSNWCIFTDEEFADDMFYRHIQELKWFDDDDNDYDWDYDYDWDWNYWDEPQGEPTLTLMVNGVASDIAVTAVDGVSYVDADGLRAILGDKAVAADMTGPVSIRTAAQAAGWDVAWYDGGWRGVEQEIQLWDKAAFEAQLAEEFAPLNDFMAKIMTMSRNTLTTKEPISGRETVSVDLTRFSTLNGDKKYTLTFAVDYTVQAGVIDMTVTFDVSQLLQMLAPADLAFLGKQEGFDLAKFTQLLKAGKMEFIVDYNEGALAYNVPLLALMDEEQTGWHAEYLYGWEDMKAALMEGQELSFVSTLYASMVNRAYSHWGGGAESALKNYRASVDGLSACFGKDCFATQNGKTTWTVTAQAVNRALGEAIGLEEPEKASFFKAFEMSYSLDDKGNMGMDAHVRFDADGIGQAMAQDDYYDFGEATAFGMLMSWMDMDITASGSGNQSHSTSQMKVHWNNVGTLEMKAQATAGTAAKGPRQVEEVAPAPALPAEADVVDPGFNFGVIGGSDGPTAIMVTGY